MRSSGEEPGFGLRSSIDEALGWLENGFDRLRVSFGVLGFGRFRVQCRSFLARFL